MQCVVELEVDEGAPAVQHGVLPHNGKAGKPPLLPGVLNHITHTLSYTVYAIGTLGIAYPIEEVTQEEVRRGQIRQIAFR